MLLSSWLQLVLVEAVAAKLRHTFVHTYRKLQEAYHGLQ
jgi:hypothetical protein